MIAWWSLEEGFEFTEFEYRAPSWDQPQRVLGIRLHSQRRGETKGKTLSLFADDPEMASCCYSALVSSYSRLRGTRAAY